MQIFIEVITVFWQAFWGMLLAIGSAVWQNLPAILEIKKIMGYFTPVGMIALYIGVPTFVLTLIIKVIKSFVKSKI